ncbi:fungal-specific transcription factor domain protein [Rhizoctonia solani 123E]|uniref:Fungal-specific transcription factor domain protein n=1 Tax=Rhizoctonia solani 123E TaxID=1423351 RepID=A0A074RIP1_9AGAM|nr:fungal-specific transcription factor domain protein [Rhizoctonia solani 123E]
MPTSRSTTGCLACKTKRKKCSESKPQCLRCAATGSSCVYEYIELSEGDRNRIKRTRPAPRTLVGQSRARAHPGTPPANLEEIKIQPQDRSPGGCNQVAANVSDSVLGTTMVANTGMLLESIDTSNPWVSLSSFNGSLQHLSTDFHVSAGFTPSTANSGPLTGSSSTSDSMPMTTGQASLLEALFSLGQSPNSPSQHPHLDSNLRANSSLTLSSNLSNIEMQDDVQTSEDEDEDPEGVVSTICRVPVLDKTAEGNALPFLLQSYATWIRRMAFEPLKMTHIARDFVFRHFADREASRWILTLLANIGSKIGTTEFAQGKNDPMLSALQYAVRRRLGVVRSDLNKTELVRALDSALETMVIHFFVSPVNDVVTLRQEAAPIFRQLCPGPSDGAIDLQALLHHPLVCLRQYAHIDILFSVIMDFPTLFQYDVAGPGSQPLHLDSQMVKIQGDNCLQWLHGTPDQLTLLFTKMKSMRQNGLAPTTEMVASFEDEIRELQPFNSSSSESFLVIVRFVVQECWRQVAFVYLYMAVCGDPSNSPRVKQAFKHFAKLLQGIKPGRSPDEFFRMIVLLMAPAAHRKRDRENIWRRLVELYTPGRIFQASRNLVSVVEDYWGRADAEGRPIVWSDVAVSRIRILGI